MEGGKPLSADVDYRGPMWHQLEFETWQHWPKIGKNFMVKFSVVEEGYAVVMCDGVRGWSEQRNSQYIAEKAEEWAGCVEADPPQMAQLMLKELLKAEVVKEDSCDVTNGDNRSNSSVAISWAETSVIFILKSHLEGLPFGWTFVLKLISHNVLGRLLSLPLSTALLAMASSLREKEQVIRRLQQKIDDLTPDSGGKGGTEIASSAVPLPPCASQALARGVGAVLSEHLGVDVYAAVRESQGDQLQVPATDIRSPSKHSGRPPRVRRGPLAAPKPRVAGGLKEELLSEAEQAARRAKIQSLAANDEGPDELMPQITPSQQSAAKPRKKKKLNI